MKNNRHKIKKMDPFKKSLEKAKLAKEEKESKVLGHEQNEIERQIKLKRRKKQTKLLQQRTSRGQPIMKHAINNILYKLEKQNQQTQEDLTQTKKTSTSTTPTPRHHSSKFHNNNKKTTPSTTKNRQPQQQHQQKQQLHGEETKKKKRSRKFY